MMDDQIEYALQIATSSMLPVALRAAIDLGVIDILADFNNISSSEIVSHFSNYTTSNPGAHRALEYILSLLASHSILTSSLSPTNPKTKLYGLSPVAQFFRKNNGSLSPFVHMIQDKLITDMWFHLKDAVVEGGKALEVAYQMNPYNFMEENPVFSRQFKESMVDFNHLLMENILNIYDGFGEISTLVDVGGGDGSIIKFILSKYPNIVGINFDVSEVIKSGIVHQGIEHVAGDMFTSIPKGDGMLLKWILHCWDDVQCIKILKNCYESLPRRGKLIAIDMVIPEIPESRMKSLHQLHLFMANMNPGGFERTEVEFRALGVAAGFSRILVSGSACNFSIIEFLKD